MNCKSKLLSALLLTIIGFSSCQKSTNTSQTQLSDIKAPVLFTLHSNDAYHTYVLKGVITVVLSQNGNAVATQYASNGTTVDFGQFTYGNYTVTATADEESIDPNTGAYTDFGNKSASQDINANSATTTATLNIQG